MNETRQSYSEDFKRKTVKFLQEQTKTLPEMAEELQIPVETLRKWMGKYRELKNEPVMSSETIRQLEQRVKQLEKDLAEEREEKAILKKAMHIFSKERP